MRTYVMPTTMLLVQRLSPLPLTAGLITVAMVGFPAIPEATVFVGVDTLVVDEGFDFSAPSPVRRYFFIEGVDDIVLEQVQDSNTATALEGGIQAFRGIRDLGATPFDSLMAIPEGMQPDPTTAIYDSRTREVHYWFVPIREGHLYAVWTQEGHVAKMFIEDLRTYPEDYGDEEFPEALWYDFISRVIFCWAYQDDGSRSFTTKTVVSHTTWGLLKLLFWEGVR